MGPEKKAACSRCNHFSQADEIDHRRSAQPTIFALGESGPRASVTPLEADTEVERDDGPSRSERTLSWAGFYVSKDANCGCFLPQRAHFTDPQGSQSSIFTTWSESFLSGCCLKDCSLPIWAPVAWCFSSLCWRSRCRFGSLGWLCASTLSRFACRGMCSANIANR
jgi:hypothetical protein